jgi:hypothetical protein
MATRGWPLLVIGGLLLVIAIAQLIYGEIGRGRVNMIMGVAFLSIGAQVQRRRRRRRSR